MPPFHNPYHFVPVKRADRSSDLSRERFEALKGGSYDSNQFGEVTHDRYAENAKSGRIICRLTTRSPLVLGAERDPNMTPARVTPYELDGWPAIPASSLRGLISSVAEAASNSALRVLANKPLLSFRQPMQRSLSAIGLVVRMDDEWYLKPLTLPTIRLNGENAPATCPPPFKASWFPNAGLRVYIGNEISIRQQGTPAFPYETYRPSDPNHFFGLRLQPRSWTVNGTLPVDAFQKRRGVFLLGQHAVRDDGNGIQAAPRLKPWEEIPETEKHTVYTRGILRVLGCRGRGSLGDENIIPNTKKHELFLPFPEDVETDAWPRLKITKCALDRFRALANERTQQSKDTVEQAGGSPLELLPFHLVNTRPSRTLGEAELDIKEGDLVFFAPDEHEPDSVAEISFSSIWRGKVEDRASCKSRSLYDFFSETDPEVLPFHPERRSITAAERLFGFAEDKGKRDKDRDALALAGRLRFSAGLLDEFGPHNQRLTVGPDRAAPLDESTRNHLYDREMTLKILSTPKPPSPAMYFKHRNGGNQLTPKWDLDSRLHEPQGRKFYIQHSPNQQSWATSNPEERAEQKSLVTPVRSGSVFHFHIDFDNLSGAELGLLLFSLQPQLVATRPGSKHFHNLGMGKPLGLGKVVIEPLGLFLVDRQKRYGSAGLLEGRYHKVWIAENVAGANWPERYLGQQPGPDTESFEAPGLHNSFEQAVEPDIAYALKLLGNHRSLVHGAPVCYPHSENQSAATEDRLFEWFTNNDNQAARERWEHTQSLEPLREARGVNSLPTLTPNWDPSSS